MNQADRSVTLDELIAFNDELVALIRAGVPLELGLQSYAQEAGQAVSEFSAGLSARMAAGRTLEESLEQEGGRLPPLYLALVRAGTRSGRLTDALEALARFGTDVRQLRRRIVMALIYPAIVAWVAYVLFVCFILLILPVHLENFDSLGLERQGGVSLLVSLSAHPWRWVWIPPLVLVGCSVSWWRAQRASVLTGEGRRFPLGWVPGFRAIIRSYETANFASLLSVLLRQQVPLDEAVTLAADASGSRNLQRASAAIAQAVVRGESPQLPRGLLPPFISWLLCRGGNLPALAFHLQEAGTMYLRRARAQAEWMRFVFPVLATVGLGGTVVLFYGLAVFSPFVALLKALAVLSGGLE